MKNQPEAVRGTLASAGAVLVLPVRGDEWATMHIIVESTTIANLVIETCKDGTGKNWVWPTYIKRLDEVSDNPTKIAPNSGNLDPDVFGASVW